MTPVELTYDLRPCSDFWDRWETVTYTTIGRPGGDVRVQAIGLAHRQCVLAFPRRARGHRPLGMHEHGDPIHPLKPCLTDGKPVIVDVKTGEALWLYLREVRCAPDWWAPSACDASCT